jgi:threonyl-tRNA synthetase
MEVEGAEYQIRPMNCPFHVLVYKDSPRSYRDLPLRWAELGTVYRYERSGTLHGLFRVRGFTQDDAHIFCLPEQLSDEILGVLDLTETILSKFGFTDYKVMLLTRPAARRARPRHASAHHGALSLLPTGDALDTPREERRLGCHLGQGHHRAHGRPRPEGLDV